VDRTSAAGNLDHAGARLDNNLLHKTTVEPGEPGTSEDRLLRGQTLEDWSHLRLLIVSTVKSRLALSPYAPRIA
jgi:hypothetical protein